MRGVTSVVAALLALVIAASALETVPAADSTAAIRRERSDVIDSERRGGVGGGSGEIHGAERTRRSGSQEQRMGHGRVSEDRDEDDSAGGERIRKFDPEAMKFDFRECEGVWYQIAVNKDFYNRYEKGCSCPIQILQARNATSGNVNLACVNMTGESKGLTILRGTKTLLPGKFALHIKGKSQGGRFVKSKPHRIEETILAVGDDFKWVLVHAKKTGGVFLYSRSKTLSKGLLNRIFKFVEKHTHVNANDMKLMEHTQQCSKALRPLLRKVKASRSRSRSRSHSRERDQSERSGEMGSVRRRESVINRDIFSGAEPPVRAGSSDQMDAQSKQKLDLNLLKGTWYAIATSRGTAPGCACGMAFVDVSGNTIDQQCACLNATAKGDDKIATQKMRLVMDTQQPGLFKARVMSRSPHKLSKDEEGKESKVILLALGKDFAACLDTTRKSVHLLSRTPTMEQDLRKALSQMVEGVGIDVKELESIKQDEALCKDFHAKAKERFGAKSSPSVGDLDKGKGKALDREARDTRDASSVGDLDKGKGKAAEQETRAADERKPQALKGSDVDKVKDDNEFISDSDGVIGSNVRFVPMMTLVPVEAAPIAGEAAAPLPSAKGAEEKEGEAPRFDTNIVAGNWFVIAVSQAFDAKYLRGCQCSQGFVTALDPNRIHMIKACINTTDNQMATCVSEGQQDADTPGLFRFKTLDKQPYGLTAAEKSELIERVVVASGKDFALIAEPAIKSVLILSRSPSMAPELYNRLLTLIEAIGFNKAQLRLMKQDLPQCQAVTDQMQAIGKQSAEPAAAASPAAPLAPSPAAPAPAAPASAPAPAPAAAAPAPAAPAPAPAPAAPAAPAAPTAPAAPAAPAVASAGRLIGETAMAQPYAQQYIDEPYAYADESYAYGAE